VTDFVSRVAARAVGASAAAQPRLAGLFEPAGTAGDATLELVEEQVVAPASRPRREGAAPAAGRAPHPGREGAPARDDRRRASAQSGDGPAAQPSQRPEPSATPVESRPPERLDLVAQSNYVPTPAALQARPPEPARDPVPVPRGERGRQPPVVVAAPLTPARAAVLRETAPPPAPAAPHSAEPPVRVHIGRLEVRANVQPPPPERPRRESHRPEGLSLADYLRGKREARA
jgi:hypothetical protein